MQGAKFEAVERGVIACQDDYGVWSTSRPDLEAALSLLRVGIASRVSGLSPNRAPLLQFRPIDQILPSEALLATHWYRRPYLYLYLVFCEGLDGYRLLVKQKIKSWVDSMIERQLEWLVIYVPIGANTRIGATARSEAERNFQRVLQKIRSDTPSKLGNFNRVCYLKLNDDRPITERYEEVIGPMQECLALAFEQRRLQYEEEIRKLEMNRAYAGWNYFTFFATKEGLAFIFEQFTLFDEALREYNELQQIYDNISQRGKLFDSICTPETGDDNIPIIKNDKKDFRSRIISSQITKFDFLRYLFAQKAWLLNSLGKQSDLLLLGLKFWRNINTDMLGFEDDVTKTFFCSWGYHFCVELAKLTESVIDMPSPTKTELQIAMGTLYQDAKTKLSKVHKLMSNSPDLGAYKISNEAILKSLSSDRDYFSIYHDATQSSHNYFQMAGRYRTSARLLFEVAVSQMNLKDFVNAESKLKSMCGYYFSGNWDDLIYYARDKLASCQKELGHIAEYTSSCLELLSAEVPCVKEKKRYYMQELATMGSTVLTHVVARSMNPIFSITCRSPKGREFPMGEDVCFECKLKSSLPENFLFDRACLRYIVQGNKPASGSKKRKTILFVTKNVTAKSSNVTNISFTGKFPAQGSYHPERIWLQKGKVILTHNFTTSDQANMTIKIMPAPTTTSLKIFRPDGLILGQQEFIKVVIMTNEDHLRGITLNFFSHTCLGIGSGGPQDLQLVPKSRKYSSSFKSMEPDDELAESNIMNDSDDEMENEQGSNVITMEAEKETLAVSNISTVQLTSEHNTSNDSNTTMGDDLPTDTKEFHDDDMAVASILPEHKELILGSDQGLLDSIDLERTSEIPLEESAAANEEQIKLVEGVEEDPKDGDCDEQVAAVLEENLKDAEQETDNNSEGAHYEIDLSNSISPEQENMMNYHRMVDVLDHQSENSSVVDPSDSYADSFFYDSAIVVNDSSPLASVEVTNTACSSSGGGSFGSSGSTSGPIISVSFEKTTGEINRSLKNLGQSEMKISQCSNNTKIELQLPVCCKEDVDKEHHFGIEFSYSNQSEDIFTLVENASIYFRAPFDVLTFVDYKPPLTFIRFVLTSRLPVPIKIESHSYILPKQISGLFQNVNDINTFTEMSVLPRDRVSFVYILERSPMLNPEIPELSLGLHLNIVSEERDSEIPKSKHSFIHNMNFSDVQMIAYEVYVRYPSLIPENEIVEIEYVLAIPSISTEHAATHAKSLRKLKKQGYMLQDQYFLSQKEPMSTGPLFYQVGPAVQHWQICGKIRGEMKDCISLPTAQETLHRVPLMIVALSAGRVALPSIGLVGCSRASSLALVHQPHRRFAEVVPPTRVIIPLGNKSDESPNPLRTR